MKSEMTIERAATTLRIRASDAWKGWLGLMLVENPNGLGSELVEALPGPNNASDADDLLAAAERLGWIERTAFAPSISQQAFFGLQYPGGVGRSETARAFHGQLHMFRVVDRAAVSAYVGASMPIPTLYRLRDEVRYRPEFVRQIRGGKEMARARGRVVGFSFGGKMPRVAWSDDPATEPACQAPIDEPPACKNPGKGARHECSCPRVPYAARAVSPAAIKRA